MQALLNLFYETTATPVYWVDTKKNLLCYLPKNPLNTLPKPLLEQLLTLDYHQHCALMILKQTYYGIIFLPTKGYFIFKKPFELVNNTLNTQFKMLYYLIFNEFLEPFPHCLDAKPLKDTTSPSQPHKTNQAEQWLLNSITLGLPLEFKRRHQQFWYSYGHLGVLDTQSNLRSQKNLAIAWITLATRAAIKGGMPGEQAYHLSDQLIQQLEKQRCLVLETFNQNAGELFAQAVNDSKLQAVSADILEVCVYLQENYAKPLNLPSLAQKLDLSVGYLQHKFKAQTKQSITTYLYLQRINKAKELLTYTSLSLTQIANQCGFEDVSYFGRVFKKYTHSTPLKWRQTIH